MKSKRKGGECDGEMERKDVDEKKVKEQDWRGRDKSDEEEKGKKC